MVIAQGLNAGFPAGRASDTLTQLMSSPAARLDASPLTTRTRLDRAMKSLSRPRTFAFLALTVLAVCFAIDRPARAEDWPAWRGPRGDSNSRETGLPVVWNAESGVAWKTPLPERGSRTPAIWGDAIFVTTQHDDDLLVLKLARQTGAIEWTRTEGHSPTERSGPKREKQKFHQLHNLASPSPVTNGELVVVHFGNGDLAAYDFDGKLHWRRNLQEDHGTYTIWWGHANSPVLYRDLVISVCMQDSLADVAGKPAESYLVAHDLQTGKERWKSARMTGAPGRRGRRLHDADPG